MKEKKTVNASEFIPCSTFNIKVSEIPCSEFIKVVGGDKLYLRISNLEPGVQRIDIINKETYFEIIEEQELSKLN